MTATPYPHSLPIAHDNKSIFIINSVVNRAGESWSDLASSFLPELWHTEEKHGNPITGWIVFARIPGSKVLPT